MPRSLPARLAFLQLILTGVPAVAQQPATPLPLKYAGPPTVPEITASDLMTRVYKFADDSMMGREVGTKYNDMGTAYIASELQRLRLQPAGDDGSYFQKLPLFNRRLDSASTITAGGQVFKAGADFVASSQGFFRNVQDAQVLLVGAWLDTTRVHPPEHVANRILLFTMGGLPQGANVQEFLQSHGYQAWAEMVTAASARMIVQGDVIPPSMQRQVFETARPVFARDSSPLQISITQSMAESLLGASAAMWFGGKEGKTTTTDVRFVDSSLPGRNVVAVLPGTDPVLKHQYVAIGAHNDHVGLARQPADHDSVKAFMQVVRPQGEDSPNRAATAEESARVRAILDSLRAVHRPRPDSIYNGADDDGSGSMTVLEIAERFALGAEKPKRSILFVWHTGEERGLWGASWFTAHPTVPRDSIVAQLNMDMVGRGAASDVTGEDREGKLLRGGEGYVQLIGSRRLSTELGDLIESVNTDRQLGLRFDYAMDANGHPQNIYCRSDHYEYARHGIPIVFLSTGGHSDYHQVTDEPQYIQYPHMAGVANLVFEAALRIGNLEHRLVVDKPKPDPKAQCVQ